MDKNSLKPGAAVVRTDRRSALRCIAGGAVAAVGFHGAVRAQGRTLRIAATNSASVAVSSNFARKFWPSRGFSATLPQPLSFWARKLLS